MLKSDWLDVFYKFYLFLGAVNYIIDSVVKLRLYGIMGILAEDCKKWFFIHHICTIIMFRSMWMVDHYTWFVAWPSAYHNLMVAFPRFLPWNNIFYGIGLVSFFLM